MDRVPARTAASRIRWEEKALSDLAPDEHNPRAIDDLALRGLDASLDEFGMVEALVWNERTGELVAGHQRRRLLLAKGVKRHMVAIGDWTPEQQRRLNVTLNNPALQGRFTGDLQGYLDNALRDLPVMQFRALRFDTLFPSQPASAAPSPAPAAPAGAPFIPSPWSSAPTPGDATFAERFGLAQGIEQDDVEEVEFAETGVRPDQLVAPFPWFGGKRRVATLVWQRFGQVQHYVEPFFGSGAVLLGAPAPVKVETVNDFDGFVSNFWRAVQGDPDGVAGHADWPVNEADLHARHAWLITQRGALTEKLVADPRYFDVEIAGWWVWGLGQWIGDGWCVAAHRKLPNLDDAERGVQRRGLPALSGCYGTDSLRRSDALPLRMRALAERLAHVRVACGDWARVLGPSVLRAGGGISGVFLDPPYSHALHDGDTYGAADIAHEVAAWAREHGTDPALRIALCGYEGEHDMPGWTIVRWRTSGGYGNQGDGRGRENAKREVVWFSPHCLRP